MKKTLIVSGTAFRDDTNTGKTLATLFHEFSRQELSQLYFSQEEPNLDSCCTYYHVCEKQLIYSLNGLLVKKCGSEVNSQNAEKEYQVGKKNPIFFTRNKDKTILLIVRELLWKFSKWNNSKLKRWLDAQQPDVIFAVLSPSLARNDFLLWASERYHAPIILFVTDDYYHDYQLSSSLFRKLYYRVMQKAFDRMIKNVAFIVGCSELASREYSERYKLPSKTILTASAREYLELAYHEQTDNRPVVFRYFGNIGLERWKTLSVLGQAIAAYNGGKKKAYLEIFTTQPETKILKALTVENCSCYGGWLHGKSYLEKLQESDVVVHVESFSPEMVNRTRISISTKIADYLGAGKCILAIGPNELASIQHLQGVSIQANTVEKISEVVSAIADSPERRKMLQKAAREKAIKTHSLQAISAEMRDLIEKIRKLKMDEIR